MLEYSAQHQASICSPHCTQSHKSSTMNNFSFTNKIHFFAPFVLFFARWGPWGLFFAWLGLFSASLHVLNSPAILLNLGDLRSLLGQCYFHQQNLNWCLFLAHLERNQRQILTAVSSGGTFISRDSAISCCWQLEVQSLALPGCTSVTGQSMSLTYSLSKPKRKFQTMQQG